MCHLATGCDMTATRCISIIFIWWSLLPCTSQLNLPWSEPISLGGISLLPLFEGLARIAGMTYRAHCCLSVLCHQASELLTA